MSSNGVDIRVADTAADFAEVMDICQEFHAWLEERYAALPWIVDTYYPDAVWRQLLDDLPLIHAYPGGIWLARHHGVAIGTIMLKGLPADGDCEMKRLVVRKEARGLGVGRKLVLHLCREARNRGFRRVLFDTGSEHHEAIGLYRSLGFTVCRPYYDVPSDLMSVLTFFEGDLATLGAADGAVSR